MNESLLNTSYKTLILTGGSLLTATLSIVWLSYALSALTSWQNDLTAINTQLNAWEKHIAQLQHLTNRGWFTAYSPEARIGHLLTEDSQSNIRNLTIELRNTRQSTLEKFGQLNITELLLAFTANNSAEGLQWLSNWQQQTSGSINLHHCTLDKKVDHIAFHCKWILHYVHKN